MLKVRLERGGLCGSDSPWFADDHRSSANAIPTRWTDTSALGGKDDAEIYPLTPGLAKISGLIPGFAPTMARADSQGLPSPYTRLMFY